jgi:hypothetical protein
MLLQRVSPPTLQEGVRSTTLLGEWYATALCWKPPVVPRRDEDDLVP